MPNTTGEHMRLISTTLAGNNQELIADALQSVLPFVDKCILIDTGITDSTLDIAKEIAKKKLVVKKYLWKNDFSDARNFALEAAKEAGADWAITVDTDERIHVNQDDIRKFLESTAESLVLMEYLDGHYRKERAFRIPTVGAYYGPTHEAFVGHASRPAVFPTARFSEIPKTVEGYRRKFERDVVILSQHTAENPNDPRWWFYLGESYKNLGQHEEGIAAYMKCYALDGWDEESAWACYKAAESLVVLGKYQRAIDTCMLGVARHPAVAELLWLAAFASYRMGRYQKAVWFGELSIKVGWTPDGVGKAANRIGFKHLPACFEGPFDVIHWSYKQMGEKDLAESYKQKCDSLYAERTSAQKR